MQKLNSRDHISYAIMKFEPNSKHLTKDENLAVNSEHQNIDRNQLIRSHTLLESNINIIPFLPDNSVQKFDPLAYFFVSLSSLRSSLSFSFHHLNLYHLCSITISIYYRYNLKGGICFDLSSAQHELEFIK